MSMEPGHPTPASRTPDPRDFAHFHQDERDRLGLKPDLQSLDGVGLALSGGGIRSASFALGVVQVLLNEDLLKRIDYFSTVSGGGYLGSALSWWLHKAATDDSLKPTPAGAASPAPPVSEGALRYEAFREQFGSKVKGSRTGNNPNSTSSPWQASNWLAYIRQHGNYLQPRGVGYPSLAASILRVCLYTLTVYAVSLIGIFSLVRAIESAATLTGQPLIVFGLGVAALATAALIVMSVFYGPATWLASVLGSGAPTRLYALRTSFRRWSGTVLLTSLVGLLIASIPALYLFIGRHAPVWLTSLSSLGLGTIGTVYQFLQGRAQHSRPAPFSSLRVVLTAALVSYGLLLGTFAAAELLPNSWWTVLIALATPLLLGLVVNTNYSGLARLYRDRLMEAFLPNLTSVAANDWTLATEADRQSVGALKGTLRETGELTRTPDVKCPRPLHLINCNTVLIDSPRDFYRNRGGDNFIISPLWSGSNATGWISTSRLGDGSVSLPTAMSISGAAANPNAAPNGLGVTRNRVVSFLMSLFNIRLGYWMANPAHADASPSNKPNLWYPGFRQGLLGSGLSEEAAFLELSDGGHFDNTGLYELVRRRTKLIIVSMAGCDTTYAMEDLANAIEKVRVDFSVFIEFRDEIFTLDALRPKGDSGQLPSTRGFAVGRIRYPKGTQTSPEYEDGVLLYLQAVPTAWMPSDVASYWRQHKDFPNDTTADQFFSEQNLEAYRELGYAVANELYVALSSDTPLSTGLREAQQLLLPNFQKTTPNAPLPPAGGA